MESNIKCQYAKLKRQSTGSVLIITNAADRNLKLRHGSIVIENGLTFSEWQLIVIKYFPHWELVDCASDRDNGCTL